MDEIHTYIKFTKRCEQYIHILLHTRPLGDLPHVTHKITLEYRLALIRNLRMNNRMAVQYIHTK